MSDRSDRLLRALEVVRASEPLTEPRWDARAREGYTFAGSGSALEDHTLADDFAELARLDYLEPVFIERISLCPNCGSHAINVLEACLRCSSSNLFSVRTLLHFRCGYVGPIDAFALESQGRRCPKCRKLLQDLGTDHDSPGEFFTCRHCNAEFQVPDVGARCLNCASRYIGVEMQKIRAHDVFAYRLTELGSAALAEGRVPGEAEPALEPIAEFTLPRHTMLALIEDERLRKLTLGERFGLVLVRSDAGDERRTFEERLRKLLIPSDKVGRLDERYLLVFLPGANVARARSTLKAIVGLDGSPDGTAPRGTVVELPDGGTAAEELDRLARTLEGARP